MAVNECVRWLRNSILFGLETNIEFPVDAAAQRQNGTAAAACSRSCRACSWNNCYIFLPACDKIASSRCMQCNLLLAELRQVAATTVVPVEYIVVELVQRTQCQN